MPLYHVIVKQLVPNKELDQDDRQESPVGTYPYEAPNKKTALDQFHSEVPISCLEHFEVSVITLPDEATAKRLELAIQCAMNPDGATDEQKAAWWETEYLRLAEQEHEAREWFAKRLGCPATWVFIKNFVSTRI